MLTSPKKCVHGRLRGFYWKTVSRKQGLSLMGVVGYSIQQEWGSFQSHPLIERDVVVEDLAVMRDTVSPREVDGAEISR